MRHLSILLISSALALGMFGQTPEPKRLALLLGNSTYQRLPPLADVPEELDLIGAALKNAGFDVSIERNFTQEKVQTTTAPEFLNKIHPGDICFFYFSGYAMQSQQDNYMLPVEFDPIAAKQDMSGATSLTAIQQILDQKQAGLKILALEASRGNPLLMTQGVGLANPDKGASREIVFAFSAVPNQWAPDNEGLFTRYLAKAIEKKGLNVDAVFNDVYKQVGAITGEKQEIFRQAYTTRDFFFHAPEKAPDPVPVKPVIIHEVKIERGPGSVGHNSRDKEDYVWIPPGTFKMGCVPSDTKCKAEEKPQHPVTLSAGFWMGRNEVKTLSYERYVDADKKNRKMPPRGPIWDEKWKKPDSTYPMAELTADEAAGYCSWAGGRLPTEAEWEYAARAGDTDKIYPFSGTEDSREQANFDGKKGNDKWDQAAPAGSFSANNWGLLDMAGNVWEWCLDKFSKTYYAESPATDPQGPGGDLPLHVVRGGSWNSDPKEHLRISYREPHKEGNTVGFRCVLPDNPDTLKLLQVR